MKEIAIRGDYIKLEQLLKMVDLISSGGEAKSFLFNNKIEVNDELNVFEKSLKDALSLLNVGGRICVITFHSLEDRVFKR